MRGGFLGTRHNRGILFPVLIFLFSLPLPVLALGTGGIGGYPAHPDPNVQYSDSWFIYTLDLGESKDDALLVSNTTEEEQTVKLYAVDSVASNQGNFALEAEDAARVGIGSWIALSETLLTLQPGESREVPFTITIPQTADVGEHSGGIIIQKADKNQVEGTGASIVTRIGIRVYETVPGTIVRQLAITDFTVERAADTQAFTISLTAENRSNVTLKPTAELVVGGWGKTSYADLRQINYDTLAGFFKRQQPFPVQFFSGDVQSRDWQLLREQTVTTRWDWPKPVFGHYNFSARLTYEGENGPVRVVSETISVWVIPWPVVGVLAGLLGVIVVLLVFQNLRHSGRRWQAYVVSATDSSQGIAGLAQRGKVSWKKIAKINKLKKPYTIQPGQKLLVPPSFPVPSVTPPVFTPTKISKPKIVPSLPVPIKPKPQPRSKIPWLDTLLLYSSVRMRQLHQEMN